MEVENDRQKESGQKGRKRHGGRETKERTRGPTNSTTRRQSSSRHVTASNLPPSRGGCCCCAAASSSSSSGTRRVVKFRRRSRRRQRRLATSRGCAVSAVGFSARAVLFALGRHRKQWSLDSSGYSIIPPEDRRSRCDGLIIYPFDRPADSIWTKHVFCCHLYDCNLMER